jgi:hypothetical protein
MVSWSGEAVMAQLRRKHDRVVFQKGFDVNIMAIDGTWRRTCVLKDVSVSGARLIMQSSIEGLILKEFFLLLSSSGLAYRRCELAWVNGDQVGANFLTVGGGRKKLRGKKAEQAAAWSTRNWLSDARPPNAASLRVIDRYCRIGEHVAAATQVMVQSGSVWSVSMLFSALEPRLQQPRKTPSRSGEQEQTRADALGCGRTTQKRPRFSIEGNLSGIIRDNFLNVFWAKFEIASASLI